LFNAFPALNSDVSNILMINEEQLIRKFNNSDAAESPQRQPTRKNKVEIINLRHQIYGSSENEFNSNSALNIQSS
jgi:hypothetical protein